MSSRFFPAILIAGLAAAVTLEAHPMGNFSVSHYARFEPQANGVDVTYVLDLAELPTFDLLKQWGLDKSSPRADLNAKAASQAREWSRALSFSVDGRALTPQFLSAELALADGAGDLPIARITSHLRLAATGGRLEYEDHNYATRAGWKEIVIRPGKGAAISEASQGSEDKSSALTAYPPDPTLAPPQDMRAAFSWKVEAAPLITQSPKPAPAPIVKPIPQPEAPPAVAPATRTVQSAPAGAVVKGDFLSRLLHRRDLTLGMILAAIVAAFGLGALHALTPGHGKTIVAAYLVGSRGTLKHAAYLGAMVTFTHTVSVFALGLATLFLFRFVMPEKIAQVLGVVSGLSIVALGGWMLWKRWRATTAKKAHVHTHHHHDHHTHEHEHAHAMAHAHAGHSHDHSDAHDHHHHNHPHPHAVAHAHAGHSHDHSHTDDPHHHHPHPHSHTHSHGPLVHSHGPGGHVHSHDVPDQITWGSLTALAISGGLVPCESALLLLLSAIALGRVGLGLILLIAFSLGLALVLVAIGGLVIYAKNLLPESKKPRHPIWNWVPVASAAIVTCVGIVMTAVSLGWLQPGWMI